MQLGVNLTKIEFSWHECSWFFDELWDCVEITNKYHWFCAQEMNGKFHWQNSTTPKVNINSIYCTIHHKAKDEEQEQQKLSKQ